METTYPIAETFLSPQGEGLYTGTLMRFVRLAGCTVGRRKPKAAYDMQLLPVWQEECTTYDGRKFLCDTDFRKTQSLSVQDIVALAPVGSESHVCLTGGEPFMHDLEPLVTALISNETTVHIETSGTIPADDWLLRARDIARATIIMYPGVWITVSPKLGVLPEMIRECDEIKLLVDDDFDEAKLPPEILDGVKLVWIQPINGITTVDKRNLDHCIQLQLKHPSWRISLQLHKIMGVR